MRIQGEDLWLLLVLGRVIVLLQMTNIGSQTPTQFYTQMLVVNIHDGSRRYFIVCMLPVDYNFS